MSIKKRRGLFFGRFLFQFLKENRFFILCHTNEMLLDTYIPIRHEFNQLNFGLKFFKRKSVLKFFDKKNYYELIKQCLNGSLAVIFSKDKKKLNLNIFYKKYKSFIMLGFFLNDFYLMSKGKKVLNKFQQEFIKIDDLFLYTKKVKSFSFFKIQLNVISNFTNYSFFNFFYFIKLLKSLYLNLEACSSQFNTYNILK